MASCEVLGWVMRNCLPPESIYLDKWLQEEDGSKTFESVNGSDNSDIDHCNISVVDDNQVQRRIREWLVGAELLDISDNRYLYTYGSSNYLLACQHNWSLTFPFVSIWKVSYDGISHEFL